MAVKKATPVDIERVAATLSAGDTLLLGAGRYDRPVVFKGLRGTAERPIRISGTPGATFDGGLPLPRASGDGMRVRQLARAAVGRLDPGLRFPGVYELADRGFLRFENCAFIAVDGLTIEDCWPTAIAIGDSHDLEFRQLEISGAAYAFQARGSTTRRLLIHRCHWVQDPSRHFLWKELTWADVHGNWGEAGKEEDGKANGWRCFDGSFFNANDIAGEVEIAHCHVEHAFNGVHLFNVAYSEAISRDIRVHHCRFSHIKDNPIEPEGAAWNWWVHDNEFHNCHKWFSLELRKVGWFYIFQNRAWADDRPGPQDDGNASGAVFKFLTKPGKVEAASAPIWVFHNSWALRSTLVQSGFVHSLQHFNNAIRFYAPDDGKRPPVYWPWTPFFGRRDAAEPERRSPPADFTRRWERFHIGFFNDVINHQDYPGVLKDCGYEVKGGIAADPGFVSPARGDLRLVERSPCRASGAGASIGLVGGGSVPIPPGLDIGWQETPSEAIATLVAAAPAVTPLVHDEPPGVA